MCIICRKMPKYFEIVINCGKKYWQPLQCYTYDNLSWWPPSMTKRQLTVVTYLFLDIMLKFGFPRILHSDNGTEFKSKLIEYLSPQLGMKKTYISPHQPQANGKWESSHRFIKDCTCNFLMDGVLEWRELLPYATVAFNWFPTPRNDHTFYISDVTLICSI